ncbi:hypothetical protein [uncultured Psychroserpens sp.]|uniref:hypothetical protein n=1 Tax=uncultured Psychroserpens sp. TaxID=255436 RepID=UPI0026108652|nr:hypothetical protein [uncultured Psychroserpens sp.]
MMNEFFFYFTQYLIYILYGLISFVILKFIFTKTLKYYHSNWNTLIEDFNYSTEDFYQLFKKELLSQGVSGINANDVSLYEGSMFSQRRRYIRVKWKEYQYDICAAPFGKGFFVSWWLLYKNSVLQIIISKIPFIGGWLTRKLFPVTYYKIDTASMFMTYAQSSVLKVIDEITKDKGIRAISENDRKPILNDIFTR